MTRPPSTAPHGEPTPPTMTAAKINGRMLRPISGRKKLVRARRTPAVDANEQLIAQVAYVTRFVSIPVAFASWRLAAVARIALPRLGYVSRLWAETTRR